MGFSDRICALLRVIVRGLDTRRGRRWFCAVLGLVFVGMGINTVRRAEFPKRKYVDSLRYSSPMDIGTKEDAQARYGSSEFRGFRRIAWGAVRLGIDPYVDLSHVRAYPPFFAIAFYPFAALWRLRGAGSGLFYASSFVFAVLSAWCCSAWARRGGERKGFGLFALTFLFFGPLAFAVMVRCETDMWVIFPMAAGFMWLTRGEKGFRAGAMLGFAASFKVLPGLFLIYLLCRRQWRAVTGMVAAGLVCTVLLPVAVWGPRRAVDLHVSWFRNVVSPYHCAEVDSFIGRPYRRSNQSLAAALHRYLHPIRVSRDRRVRQVNVAEFSEEAVCRLVQVLHVCIGAGLVLLWLLCVKRGEGAMERAVLTASAAAGILLLSEVSLTTHHVLLLLPLGAIVVRMIDIGDGRARRWAWVVAIYVLAMCVVPFSNAKAYSPLLPATLALLIGCMGLAIGDSRRLRLRRAEAGS